MVRPIFKYLLTKTHFHVNTVIYILQICSFMFNDVYWYVCIVFGYVSLPKINDVCRIYVEFIYTNFVNRNFPACKYIYIYI
jgi:hypothetical protein